MNFSFELAKKSTLDALSNLLKGVGIISGLAIGLFGYQTASAYADSHRSAKARSTIEAEYAASLKSSSSSAKNVVSVEPVPSAQEQFAACAISISATAKALGLEITHLKAGETPAGFVDPITVGPSSWQALECEVDIVGNYSSLRTFVSELENQKQIIEISAFDMNRLSIDDTKDKSIIEARLKLFILAPGETH